MKAWLILFGILVYGPAAQAVDIPTDLSRSDRLEVIRILGVSTTSKLLSNPYPLGGYPGLEVGVSLEVVNTQDLASLGATLNEAENEFRFPRLSIGKGLYYNVDMHFHFIPYNETTGVSEFGGMFKWAFYEAKFLPITLSFIGHGSNINVGDQFTSQSFGGDFMVGINANSFALYFGGGQISSTGRFMATGTDAITDESPTAGTIKESLTESHSFVGISLQIWRFFAAAQIDRYRDPTYSAKLGVRF